MNQDEVSIERERIVQYIVWVAMTWYPKDQSPREYIILRNLAICIEEKEHQTRQLL